MKIQGLINYKSNNHNGLSGSATRFSKKNTFPKKQQYHKYAGVVSADLAYASMFDNKIAKELKMMGLI